MKNVNWLEDAGWGFKYGATETGKRMIKTGAVLTVITGIVCAGASVYVGRDFDKRHTPKE